MPRRIQLPIFKHYKCDHITEATFKNISLKLKLRLFNEYV